MRREGGLAASGPGRVAASLAVLLVAAGLFVAMRAPLLAVPFERDEGEYAYIAQRMLEGELPYRDAFDQKPPGVFLAYLAAFVLFGQSVEVVHAFAACWLAATGAVLFALVRRQSGTLAASFSVLIFGLASADTQLGANAANTELFMLLPMVASVLCALRAVDSGRGDAWWVAAGGLAAAACWFKQTAAMNALFVAAIAVAAAPGRRAAAGGVGRRLAALAAGAVLAVAPVAAFFAFAGAWAPFFDAVVVHNLAYVGGNSWQQGLQALAFWLPRQAPGLGVFWALAAAAVLVPRLAGCRAWALYTGWLLASLLGVSVGFYFRPHYFVQALPPLAALGGVTLGAGASRLLDRAPAPGAVAGVAACVLLAVLPPWLRAAPIRAAETPEARSRWIYGDNPFPEAVEIGDYIRRSSAPDGRVYILGSEPEVLFYANRRSATRYIFFYPLTGDYRDAISRQREVIDEVEAARPEFVVLFNVSTSLLADESTEQLVFEHAATLLGRGYQLEIAGVPAEGRRGFQLHYAAEVGRRALRRMLRDAPVPEWIAVYRRIP